MSKRGFATEASERVCESEEEEEIVVVVGGGGDTVEEEEEEDDCSGEGGRSVDGRAGEGEGGGTGSESAQEGDDGIVVVFIEEEDWLMDSSSSGDLYWNAEKGYSLSELKGAPRTDCVGLACARMK